MIGDGLNDAGALLAANTGISVTDNNTTLPRKRHYYGCYCITSTTELINLSKSAVTIIIISFIISLLYNFVGLALCCQRYTFRHCLQLY